MTYDDAIHIVKSVVYVEENHRESTATRESLSHTQHPDFPSYSPPRLLSFAFFYFLNDIHTEHTFLLPLLELLDRQCMTTNMATGNKMREVTTVWIFFFSIFSPTETAGDERENNCHDKGKRERKRAKKRCEWSLRGQLSSPALYCRLTPPSHSIRHCSRSCQPVRWRYSE